MNKKDLSKIKDWFPSSDPKIIKISLKILF